MRKVLVISASYREGGTTDLAVEVAVKTLVADGAQVEIVPLRDYPIEFCHNCRECTQQPGEVPGRCVIPDHMQALVDKIETADALIFAAPTNFYSVTALFKRFMERLVVYGYWPWNAHAPKLRKAGKAQKPALLITSAAAPTFIGSWFYSSLRQLSYAAKTVGAKPVGKIFLGLAAKPVNGQLGSGDSRRIASGARQLLAG